MRPGPPSETQTHFKGRIKEDRVISSQYYLLHYFSIFSLHYAMRQPSGRVLAFVTSPSNHPQYRELITLSSLFRPLKGVCVPDGGPGLKVIGAPAN